MDLPKTFLQRMQDLLGSEYAAFIDSFTQQDRSYGLRANTLKISPQALAEISPWPLEGIPWSPSGFYYERESRPGPHPFYYAGLYYIQEPSAQAVAELANPQPGERVLDLCASPGGKTTHLAALMQGQGLLVANEYDSTRQRGLLENIERWGMPVVVTSSSIDKLAAQWGPYFDKVVLDAPCSGEGMFRKDPAVIAHWGPLAPARAGAIQADLLQSAAQLLRPGGVLVYSTCTFAPEENEDVLKHFLEQHPNFALENALLHGSFMAGSLPQTARLFPHKLRGEGHFLAKLRKVEGEERATRLETGQLPQKVNKQLWQQWQEQHLTHMPLEGDVVERSGHLYLRRSDTPTLEGIKSACVGLYLGEARAAKHKGDGRFLPSRSLAFALKPEHCVQRFALRPEDSRAMRFIKGEPIEAQTDNGWCMVTLATAAGEFNLGWGKSKSGVIRPNKTGL